MPLWAALIVAAGVIGTYVFGLIVIAAAMPDDPSIAQIVCACLWPVYPIVRLVLFMGGVAQRIGLAIRRRREIPAAIVRSEGDGTRNHG